MHLNMSCVIHHAVKTQHQTQSQIFDDSFEAVLKHCALPTTAAYEAAHAHSVQFPKNVCKAGSMC